MYALSCVCIVRLVTEKMIRSMLQTNSLSTKKVHHFIAFVMAGRERTFTKERSRKHFMREVKADSEQKEINCVLIIKTDILYVLIYAVLCHLHPIPCDLTLPNPVNLRMG